MLHSGRHHPQWARWSILAQPDTNTPPLTFSEPPTFPSHNSPSCQTKSASHNPSAQPDPFDHLRQTLAQSTPGLWLGYLAYDLGRYVEKMPTLAKNDRDWPLYSLHHCPGYLLHDAATNHWYACGTWQKELPFDLAPPPPDTQPPPPPPIATYRADQLTPQITPDQFRAAVRQTIDYIAAGDIFQANLAQRFSAQFTGDWPAAPRALFAQLARISPAWYGAYLEIDPQHTLASTSPELFLQLDNQHVITRPIKGTRPANTDVAELQHSEKDAAELNMIVDLLRNDLGRVSRYGSVHVTQPRTIESHPTIHHGVATIESDLRADCDLIDLLRATLPGGSITGAPKIRAMQIIDELEPSRRGPYCGCIGFIDTTHGLDHMQSTWNIAIRTLCLEPNRVDFSVGGGIVADSDPQSEYQETLDKAAALLRALGLNQHT